MTAEKMFDPVLINEWYAVMRESQLTDKPVGIKVLGERVVIFRNSEGVHAWKDLCIHRGAMFSKGGYVEKDRLVCPYHGWQYNSKGNCVCIPAQPEKAIPLKALAKVFHCEVKHGLVWVNMGEPIVGVPPFEESNNPAFRTVQSGPYIIEAMAPRILENFMDFAHLMFVHRGLIGDPSEPKVPEYKVHMEKGWPCTEDVLILQPNSDASGKEAKNYIVKEALRPFTARLRKTNSVTGDIISIMITVNQMEKHKAQAFCVISRNFAHDVPDEEYEKFQDLTMSQDIEILEGQKPEELPLDLQAELSLRCDQMSIAYRKWLNELGITIGTA
ncbi:aromatic ring-hydroxylating dioxygenase subunit alpha [Bacillus sp. JJ1474]|uniref:aromatic ring-hydroxylating dioxygenase subunit alpha n=1 Tax=Bacillus sp. JJ1474 TaxID=3122955 RepID=UPI003000090B